MKKISIPKELIHSPDGQLLAPSDFSSPEQQALLTDHEKCHFLSRVYRREFAKSQNKAELDGAIFFATRVIEIYTSDNALAKKYHFHLGDFTASRYARYEDESDLVNAIEALQISVSIKDDKQEDNPTENLTGNQRAKALKALSQCLQLRYENTGSDVYFEDSLGYLTGALDIYEELGNAENKAICYISGADLLREKYLKNGEDESLLLEAIDWAGDAVGAVDAGTALWHEGVEVLANLYYRLYNSNQDESRLQLAIETLEDAFEMQENGAVMARWHFALGKMYLALTKITQDPEDGSEASSHLQGSLQLTPGGHPSRSERLAFWRECADYLSENNNLGLDIRGRPTRAEIYAMSHCINKVIDDNPEEAARLYKQKAFMYYARYQSGEKSGEADDAIDMLIESVNYTPPEDQEQCIERRRTIAIICDEVFSQSDLPRFLDRGIPYAREAVELCESATSVSNSVKALAMHTAARILCNKYEEDSFGNGEMAAEAVRCAARAVELMNICCDKDDGCQECEDRGMFTRDLQSMRQVTGIQEDETTQGPGEGSPQN
ncbi:hypothetical protein BDV12DRAFT_196784 [Aspergillus spectabilis]